MLSIDPRKQLHGNYECQSVKCFEIEIYANANIRTLHWDAKPKWKSQFAMSFILSRSTEVRNKKKKKKKPKKRKKNEKQIMTFVMMKRFIDPRIYFSDFRKYKFKIEIVCCDENGRRSKKKNYAHSIRQNRNTQTYILNVIWIQWETFPVFITITNERQILNNT